MPVNDKSKILAFFWKTKLSKILFNLVSCESSIFFAPLKKDIFIVIINFFCGKQF